MLQKSGFESFQDSATFQWSPVGRGNLTNTFDELPEIVLNIGLTDLTGILGFFDNWYKVECCILQNLWIILGHFENDPINIDLKIFCKDQVMIFLSEHIIQVFANDSVNFYLCQYIFGFVIVCNSICDSVYLYFQTTVTVCKSPPKYFHFKALFPKHEDHIVATVPLTPPTN